jgi:hypothetical protein
MSIVYIILVLLVLCVSVLIVKKIDRFLMKLDMNIMALEATPIFYVPFSYTC